MKKGIAVISSCLQLFTDGIPNHWKFGDGPGGYLCTNNEIRALFHVIKDVTDHIQQQDGSDLCLFDSDETFALIRPYLDELVDFFKAVPPQEIQALRRIGPSLTAVSWPRARHEA